MHAVTSRAEWAATETSATRSVPTVSPVGIAVHHTAGTNSYSAAQVPAILRGIQRFHVRDRGWSDIGYNVLVDRYGHVWEGRRGGITSPHRGAHASGVNDMFLGVSYMGDTSSAPTTEAGVDALVDVIALAAVRHGFDPTGAVAMHGRWAGQWEPVVPAHYQVGSTRTDCPGRDLIRRLPAIRIAAGQRVQELRADG